LTEITVAQGRGSGSETLTKEEEVKLELLSKEGLTKKVPSPLEGEG